MFFAGVVKFAPLRISGLSHRRRSDFTLAVNSLIGRGILVLEMRSLHSTLVGRLDYALWLKPH